MFFGNKILNLESDFRKLGSVAVLRSLIRILCASLVQTDTEMAEKYAKLAEIFAKLGKAAKLRSIMISEEEIRFLDPDYDPDRAQKLISLSMSRHLSTRNISSKSMHTFLSNLAHRQTNRQTDKQTDKGARACGRKHSTPPRLSEVKDYKQHCNKVRHRRP